jgi:transcriptional regulator with XRE-family HTH domain
MLAEVAEPLGVAAMPEHPFTTVRSRRVGTALRGLREAAGLSCQDVAGRLGISAGLVGRLEAGDKGLRLPDVAALLSFYEADPEFGADVLAMVRQCHRRTWWTRSEPRHWRSLCHLEASARRVSEFQPHLVPALLRTVGYTRAVLSVDLAPRTPEEIETLIALQESRQAAFDRPGGPSLEAIVDEYALSGLRDPDPVNGAQVRHLLAATARPGVTLRMIPASVGLHAGLHGPFTMYRCGGDVDVAYTEQLLTAMFFQCAAHVDVYGGILAKLRAVALSPGATRDYVASLCAD